MGVNNKYYDNRTYHNMHHLIRQSKGLASQHDCPCGVKACDWALQRDADPSLVDSYVAMCRQCHMRYDNNNGGRNNKITEKEVLEIRELYSSGKYQIDIADKYGISQGQVSMIVNKRSWQNV